MSFIFHRIYYEEYMQVIDGSTRVLEVSLETSI